MPAPPQPDYGGMTMPSVWRTNRTQAAAKVDALSQRRHGRVRDPGVPAQAGRLMAARFATSSVGRLPGAAIGALGFGRADAVLLRVRVAGTVKSRRMLPQRTLKSMTRAVGVGLHSGQRVELTLRPAPAGRRHRVPPRRPAASRSRSR